jgi:hypothetical protein
MTIENLLCSVEDSYLHFNRVDAYIDFPAADPHDGQQLPNDLESNSMARFGKAPWFSAADYYNQSRARTYACCFSLENSDFIWNNYGKDTKKGKVCIVFLFGKLRAILNKALAPENAVLDCNGARCHQIFSINYGLVEYIDWSTQQSNQTRLPNPIKYSYLKNRRFLDENELRVTLSALGIGHYVLNDGGELAFPPNLHFGFSFKKAIVEGAIQEILYAQNSDSEFLCNELSKLGIVPNEFGVPSLSGGGKVLPNKDNTNDC